MRSNVVNAVLLLSIKVRLFTGADKGFSKIGGFQVRPHTKSGGGGGGGGGGRAGAVRFGRPLLSLPIIITYQLIVDVVLALIRMSFLDAVIPWGANMWNTEPPENISFDPAPRAQPHAAEDVVKRHTKNDKPQPKPRVLTKKYSLPITTDADTPVMQSPLPPLSAFKHVPPPPSLPLSLHSPPPPPALTDPRPISLAKFVEKYSNFLPAEVTVTTGGSSSHITLSNEDMLEVHQVRELSVILVKTSDNRHLRVPLNFPTELCLLYDPEDDITKTIRGYTFERVADLIEATPRPRLVCVRSTWEGRTGGTKDGSRVALDDREVLVVGEVVFPAAKKKGKKRHLKVYSITRQVEKLLPDDCPGNFSTKPLLLPLYLPEITGYVPDPFPCKAVLQEEGMVVQPQLASLISQLSGRVLTLTAMTKEPALVTTLMKDKEGDADGSWVSPVMHT